MPVRLLSTLSDEMQLVVLAVAAVPDRLSGLVVVELNDKGEPTRYMAFPECFYEFGSETTSEDPKTFRTLKRARMAIERESEDRPDAKFDVAYWVHPESHYKAIEKYGQVTGGQLPGSPRH